MIQCYVVNFQLTQTPLYVRQSEYALILSVDQPKHEQINL